MNMTKIQPSPELSKSSLPYSFLSCRKNPNYVGSLQVPFIPCHIYNNSSKLLHDNSGELVEFKPVRNLVTGRPVYEKYCNVSIIPKWVTSLQREDGFVYQTDDFKSAKLRKIKACQRFFSYYEPLYQAKVVSLLLFTFSRMNYARLSMPSMLECIKERLESLKWRLRGYMWVLELKPNSKMWGGFHLHYHLVVAVDRVSVKTLPEPLKLSQLWGQRVQVQFIKKSLRNYMSKYLYKSEGKVIGYRSYQVSQKLL